MNVKILYAEDELFLGKIVKESLESRGFTVLMETDGARVAGTFSAARPDICVLDIMLPNVDGYTLAARIREMDATIPIIFLTAKTQTEDLVKGFKTGGNDYIRKPFSMEELIVRIEHALKLTGSSNKKKNPVETFAIGSYRFHCGHQLLRKGNKEQKLSFREAELLKFLFENRNAVIDRRNILNLLWGNDNFFNSRNLDVYITKLRAHLKEDPGIEILTIKGIGYRFIIP